MNTIAKSWISRQLVKLLAYAAAALGIADPDGFISQGTAVGVAIAAALIEIIWSWVSSSKIGAFIDGKFSTLTTGTTSRKK